MYISIDLGGTNTRIAASKDCVSIDKKVRFPTFDNLQSEKATITSAIAELTNDYVEKVHGICVGVPGFIDYEKNKIGKVINVPYLSNITVAEFFDDIPDAALVSSKVLFANDAAIAGLGEAVYGIAKTEKALVYITLSTGVGGVRILNKHLDTTQKYFEPGHMVIYPEGRKSFHTGQSGSWDAYCSGVSFMQQYNIMPQDCVDQNIWTTYGKNLAFGIFNVISMWAPDVIVIGGSVSIKHPLFEKAMFDTLISLNNNLYVMPDILFSTLGHENGLLGGFVFLSQNPS